MDLITWITENPEAFTVLISAIGGAIIYAAKVYVQVTGILSEGIEKAEPSGKIDKDKMHAKRSVEHAARFARDPLVKLAIKRIAKRASRRVNGT